MIEGGFRRDENVIFATKTVKACSFIPENKIKQTDPLQVAQVNIFKKGTRRTTDNNRANQWQNRKNKDFC